MRVGTDGVLLGAWADVTEAKNVLDIGTGTGLIAIMLAQRNDTTRITGIEIEHLAAKEANENAQNSRWSERIKFIHQKFQEFAEQTTKRFDCIVTNPPFFSNSEKNANSEKSVARHNHQLPFGELLKGTIILLTENGKLSIILPVPEAKAFIEQAHFNRLFLSRLMEIKPSVSKAPNRYLMEFTKKQVPLKKESLSIHAENGVDYTEEYKHLTSSFYLNF